MGEEEKKKESELKENSMSDSLDKKIVDENAVSEEISNATSVEDEVSEESSIEEDEEEKVEEKKKEEEEKSEGLEENDKEKTEEEGLERSDEDNVSEEDEEKKDDEDANEEEEKLEELEENDEDENIDNETDEEVEEKQNINGLLSDAQKSMEEVSEKVSEDSELPISRDEAIELLMSFPQEQSDKNHYLESEAIMKALAKHFGEDEEYWGMLGLLHDVDWYETKNDIENHTIKAEEILREKGFDDKFINLVQSHAYGYEDIPVHKDKERRKRIEFALASAETLTGLIYAYALMRGGRVSDMKVKGLKKKFNDKAFAAGCSRDLILEIENIGLDLDEYFEMAIEAISDIRHIIGLE